MPTKAAAALFGAWMMLLGVLFVLVSGLEQPIRLIAGATAVFVIELGVRRRKPDRPALWRILEAAVTLNALATMGQAMSAAGALAQAANWFLLADYPLLALALVLFAHDRTGGGRDRGGLLDAFAVTTGLTLLAWALVIAPHLRSRPGHGSWLEIAYPIGDLICLAALARLFTASTRRIPAAWLLGAGVAALLASDVGFNLVRLSGHFSFLAAFGRIPLYAAIALAALHPSMRELTRPAPPSTDLSRARLILLAISSLIAPCLLLAAVTSDYVIAALSAVTFLLVLGRMAGIMASHRLALARERGLREASAALVSATNAEQVNDAVRTGVAQLLPGDVAHRVVLAMAIDQPDEPLDGPQAAQAAHDRAGGTAATLVATRDLDWAAATRMNQFNMVLRCPLVLQDRPAGDPLVGVLHVGGPTWALLGLQRSLEVLASQVALALERIELSSEVAQRNSETYFRTLVLNTSDVIAIVDDDDRLRYASPSAQAVLGGDPIGVLLSDIVHPADRARLADLLAAVRAGHGPEEGIDFRALDHRAEELMLEIHSRDLRADTSVAGLIITMRNVTERRRLERDLTYQAFHDSLTGLANRVLFTNRLEHALARGARDGSQVGVLFIDLDDFKIVNDTLGHAVGDLLLKAVASRISGALRADDTAARLGGDEFAALIENVQDPGAVEETATRILTALAEPILVDGGALHAVASIGITTTPEADNADELLRQADLALYVAKGAGKGQWRRYQTHLHQAMVDRLELRAALDHAVNEGHFLLQYQPIVSLANDEAVGFEALIRWAHPVRGIIAPDQFIEVAEESGLIVPMGRWVLDQALHTVAQWRRVLPRVRQPYVSVNVSVRQFRQSGFVEHVKQALAYVDVPPRALMLEITETLLMRDDEQIWSDLRELQALGVRIAIDDFGTGYSSLSYLRQRPIDVIKIDKSFIDDMLGGQQQLALVTGIISLAQSLNLTVVAEGIEDTTHRDLLARLRCPLGQGYLFSPPISSTEALTWMTGTAAETEEVYVA
jgi:diguanylate cyclase (GGDEF)-like protein/PAS domain S-box-containing protein